MSRTAFLSLAALVAAAAPALPAAAEEAYTTRIEPRNAYGATVTIEQGVRVFRPLPTERQVIVNPGGMTPLSLYYGPAGQVVAPTVVAPTVVTPVR